MPDSTAALDFLSAKRRSPPPPVCVVFGDETFLVRMVLAELRQRVLPGEDAEFAFRSFSGPQADVRSVFDELDTIALFGGSQRLVLVEEADEFVSKNRPALEDYVARERFTGTLVLQARSWPKNTRLYKTLAAGGLQIDCKQPTAAKLRKWLTTWAVKRHEINLDGDAAELLIEIVGPQLGLLDQELAKLSGYAGAGQTVTAEMVQQLTGTWRTKTTWEMLDAAASGDAVEALRQLDRLLGAGEHPIAILGPLGYTLRRFAAATRLIEQAGNRRLSLGDALGQAGVKPFALRKSETQLRQLGRRRAGRLYRWLLESDLQLKGDSRLPPRVVLERLIVRMGRDDTSPKRERGR